MVMVGGLLRGSATDSPRQLYMYLLRECRKLPRGPQEYYKHSVKQSFKQHANEPDAERVKEIIEKAYADSKWILKKYAKDSSQA